MKIKEKIDDVKTKAHIWWMLHGEAVIIGAGFGAFTYLVGRSCYLAGKYADRIKMVFNEDGSFDFASELKE